MSRDYGDKFPSPIPISLFWYMPNLIDVEGCFNNAFQIMRSIPGTGYNAMLRLKRELLWNGKELENKEGKLKNCKYLFGKCNRTIAEIDLLYYIRNSIENMEGMFWGWAMPSTDLVYGQGRTLVVAEDESLLLLNYSSFIDEILGITKGACIDYSGEEKILIGGLILIYVIIQMLST